MRALNLLTVGVLVGVIGWELPRRGGSPELAFGINDDDMDIATGSQFNGLRTFAGLPYLNCFSDEEAKGHQYDIAVMGAPHDTVGSPIR